MKKIYQGRVPYDPITKDLMHYPEPRYHWDGVSRESSRVDPLWRENVVFGNTLTVKDYARGRSAAYFLAESPLGVKYPIFMKDFMEMLPLMDKGVITGQFAVAKRGQNYGLVLISSSG